MRQKVFVQRIEGKEDMALLESTIGCLLGGEKNKCSLVRCNEFVQLRLRALYGKGVAPVHVYGEGLQISLTADNVASVYLLTSYVEPDEGLLGKRSEPEPAEPAEKERVSQEPGDDDEEEGLQDCPEQTEPVGASCIKEEGS